MTVRVMLILLILLAYPLGLAQKNAGDPTVEVIVEFGGPALPKSQTRQELVRILQSYLGQMKQKLKVQSSEGFWVSQSLLVRLPQSQVGALINIPGVVRVYPNRPVKLVSGVANALAVPSDQGSDWALEKIGAKALWSAGLKGQGIRIGHLDTGVDASHSALKGKVAAFAVIDANGTPKPSEPYDSAQHGTYTAGLLVGDGVGVAPDAKIVSALVLPEGNGTLAQVLGGLDWVLEQNVNIVSMSLGMEGNWIEFAPVVERMKQMGVLPVFAIGNSGNTTTSPGNMPGVLGVGAVDQDNKLASFSSRGQVRWGDPYNVVLDKPDLVAPGVNVMSAIPGGRFMAMSGTSTSTALVAGSAALLMSGGAKADAVKNTLLSTALPLQAGTGKGLIQLRQAWAALGGNPPQQAQTIPNPTNLQARFQDGKILLTWDPVPGATGYEVRELSASGPQRVENPRFTDTNLNRGSPYRYVVKTLKGNQASSGTDQLVVNFSTGGQPTPPPNSKSALLVVETDGLDGGKAALENLGLKPDVMKIKPSQRPGPDKLKNYPLVVWVLEKDWTQNWPEAQRLMLRGWVQSGGRLLLITQEDKKQPISETSSYGSGKATFFSGDLARLSLEERASTYQKVIRDLLR